MLPNMSRAGQEPLAVPSQQQSDSTLTLGQLVEALCMLQAFAAIENAL